MSSNDGEISMSFDETNALRISLGLKPLNADKKADKVVHVDPSAPPNADDALAARLEDAKNKRSANRKDVKALSETTGAASSSADDWVKSMRAKNPAKKIKSLPTTTKADKANAKQTPASAIASETASASAPPADAYSSTDLHGHNIKHSAAAFEAGSSTILTLADSNILDTNDSGAYEGLNEDEGINLENVNLADEERIKQAKKKKQQLSNLAQGYAAYDDDEFDELGGSGVSQSANAASSLLNKYDEDSSNGAGFTLTSGGIFAADPDADMTDFDKQAAGKAMSLATTNAVSNDYMTLEEQEAAKPKKKKEFKKKEKKEKKSKGKKRERAEDEGENDEDTQPTLVIKPAPKKSMLAELASTETVSAAPSTTTKRTDALTTLQAKNADAARAKEERIKRFQQTMLKGNERQKAKGGLEIVATNADGTGGVADLAVDNEGGGGSAAATEEDDPVAKAALAKAARLKKLKAMRGKKVDVVAAVAETKASEDKEAASETTSGGMTIAFDDTSEFARKLKTQQQLIDTAATDKKVVEKEPVMSMEEMEDMAKNMASEEDMNQALEAMDETEDGEIAAPPPAAADSSEILGLPSAKAQEANSRGMSGILAMLKSTGDLSGKKAGKEELRGRGHDEKTYDDYKATNLDSVVRIDRDKATDKDKLYAKREVKLEYRDDHGRLLTRKEAFRQLCYQFHGYGSGKKNEEKRLKIIERENEAREQRTNEQRGTMGALKKAQKNTGKAYLKLS